MTDPNDKHPGEEPEKIKFETMKFDGDRPDDIKGVNAFDIALEELRSKLTERFSATDLQRGGEAVREEAK